MLLIRSMESPADLDFAASCTGAEGWVSETHEVFETFFAYDGSACFIAELDNRRVGICTTTSYGESAFLGELIVLPDARGRGIGAELMNHAIALLRGEGVRNILLDGVLKAIPLYERLGFRKLARSLRFSGPLEGASSPHVRPMIPADLDAVLLLDCSAFGADRSFFLERRLDRYPDLCKVLVEDGEIAGCLMARPRPDGYTISPWVVRPGSPAAADLIRALIPTGETATIALGVLESNSAAVALIRSLGFQERADSPWRMVNGLSGALASSDFLYAIGSAAKG